MRQRQTPQVQGVRLSTQRLDLGDFTPTVADFEPYHRGEPRRGSQVPAEQRRFIAWDGEGINRDGPNKPQSYVLFGASTGEYLESETHLHTFELLDFILSVGNRYPAAFHVGFAFNYDVNMVLRSLHSDTLARIHKDGGTYIRLAGRGTYYIQFRPSKWFSVTKFGVNYDRQKNPYDKQTVRIFDLFGFFQSSFVVACEKWGIPVPDLVREGKNTRGSFVALPEIRKYWTAEIALLQQLAETLRRVLFGAGYRLTSWHGPGALASLALRQKNIKHHMDRTPDPVREASRYAYAGGRFEMFQLGRTVGPIYSVDINSAYPYGISQLPSLTNGEWKYVSGPPERLARFGVYHVRLLGIPGDTFLERAAGPLFHRDRMGNISFPWVLDGWYWSPEVRNLSRLPKQRYEIVEGWEFRTSGTHAERVDLQTVTQEREPVRGSVYSTNKPTRPFLWVRDVYEQRRDWKSRGIAGERALKLVLNSLYGKMAQRVGWDQENRKPPQWHQLEWAGWVTSNTRAMLWEVMSRIPRHQIIAVETDGLYTTMPPSELGIAHSSELGGWDVTVYDEILYVQSGMAWLRKGNCGPGCEHGECPLECNAYQKPSCEIHTRKSVGCAWVCKRRGLDKGTFGLRACIDYLKHLEPRTGWAPYEGQTTRFIGLGNALNASAPFKVRHCVWETVPRIISPGKGGKRIHVPSQCSACLRGLSAYEASHDMSIRSLAYLDSTSHPHDIPWENEAQEAYAWREYQETA